MKVSIMDNDALRSLRPLDVSAYLHSHGWQMSADLNGRGQLWLLLNGEGMEFDVSVPSRRDVSDYPLRMGELLRTLSEVEQRSQLDVLRDVLTTTADLIRIRAPSSEGENGTLPLERAVAFVGQSRELMLAAACAALNKRAYFAKRKAQQAMDYLEHVRMGQTERGSYVLTILSPVAPELRPVQADMLTGEIPEPFERHVTRTLMRSLDALEGAARQAAIQGEMGPFTDAIKVGVSANLCEAVVGMSGVGPGEGLDIQVSWSRTRPLEADFPRRVQFDSDSIPIIEEAGRHFRETAPIEDFEVRGFVTHLDRGPTAVEGAVTVDGLVDDRLRRITMVLGPQAYTEAVRAHDQRRSVKCTGELVKEGRSYRLQSPRHFEVLTEDDN